MHITIENNTVIVNLDAVEFPIFEAMFANLQLGKKVSGFIKNKIGLYSQR